MRAAAFGAAVLLALSACGGQAPDTRLTLHAFGATTEVELRHGDAEQRKRALEAVRSELLSLQHDLHAWQPSPLTTLNAALARGESAAAPDSILPLIERSRSLVKASDGLFDPGAGGLFALWGFHTDTLPITSAAPEAAVIQSWLAQRPRFDDITIVDGQVHSRHRGIQLDFGAVGRGLALQRSADVLAGLGVDSARLRIGDDTLVLGDDAGQRWQSALEDPFGGVLAELELDDGEALFTLGNFSRFREAPDGGRWPHVLDPRTGYPARGSALVAVLHGDALYADATSTILFIGGPAQFASLVERLQLGCALMLTEENELLLTQALKSRLRLQRSPVELGAAVDSGDTCTPST
ncbi:MAG TPA: FAD:protein FMN transferase [Arenimonas sp.]|nr:FAD:protein FMN transferase [Arenimonas sp.]